MAGGLRSQREWKGGHPTPGRATWGLTMLSAHLRPSDGRQETETPQWNMHAQDRSHSFCEGRGPGLCIFRVFPLGHDVSNSCLALSHVCGCSAMSQGIQAWSGLCQDPGPFTGEGFSDHSLDAHHPQVITASRPFCGQNQGRYIFFKTMNFPFKFNIMRF